MDQPERRKDKRLVKRLYIKFAVAQSTSKAWDMCVVDNISAGGIKFVVSDELDLSQKSIHLQIKLPELAPAQIEVQALVLETKPRPNSSTIEVRAKFINLTDIDKNRLSIIERIVQSETAKEAKKNFFTR